MMGDAELELSLAEQEEEHQQQQQQQQQSPSSTASPSVSISSSPSLSLPSSPSSGPHHHHHHQQQQQPPSLTPSPSESPAAPSPPLDVISEGVGELSLVIDPEVAKRACHQVLQQVKQLTGDGGGGGEAPGLEGGTGTTTATGRSLVNGGSHLEASADTAVAAGGSGGVLKAPRICEEEGEAGTGEAAGAGEGEDPVTAAGAVAAGSVKSARRRQRHNPSKQSWLLRLFESKLFDVSMAISYLHNSKEPGVQAYIGNRLFSFRHEEVDFYLPQLLNMYIHMDEDVGDAIKPYVVGGDPS